ncbi:MAG: pantothenate synthetase [Thermonema sp.]|uniref:pantoate--beta-alanine ligase n=1 Tax=Thermonema sp. TaxID=2231181 RepID=UPI0021DF3A8C|nr:pantoate--beta-alanine ligase [Thermonema sp.]GIV39610.1 MAG: pantothenate synthetase [Thermonema sp.]
MLFLKNPQEAHLQCLTFKKEGKSIGFIPTMGALHEGHLSLVRRAKEENDVVVCSIFVNPTQFNDPTDLAKYPRTLEADRRLLESVGCDLLFAPQEQEMYPAPPVLRFSFGHLEQVMEGAHRPGHFNGVALVVSKLFHIVQPNKAYFGQKDYQQYLIIRQLVADLSFPVEVVPCPIVREADGLAMSSRNRRLTPAQRREAVILYQTLQEAKQRLLNGVSVEEVKKWVASVFAPLQKKDIRLEYFEVADGYTLSAVKDIHRHKEVVLCIAAYVGEVRLIDNVLLFS